MNCARSLQQPRLVLDVEPTPEKVSAAGATIAEALSQNYGAPDLSVMAQLAAVELLSNILRHGAPCAAIRVGVRCRQRAVSIAIADDGPPFDMSARACKLPDDPYADHGRGLWIVNHTVERFRYRCVHGKNIHILTINPG